MRTVVLSLNVANALFLQKYMYASTHAFIHAFILLAFIGHLYMAGTVLGFGYAKMNNSKGYGQKTH